MGSRKHVEEEARAQGPGLLVSLWRLLNTLLAVGILVYGAAWVALRTDGVKGLVREKFEERIGLKIAIGAMRGDAGFNLTLDNVSGRTTNEASEAGVVIGRLRLDWDVPACLRARSLRFERVTCEGGRLVFERAGTDWVPEDLAGAGDWIASWLGVPVPVETNTAAGAMAADSGWAGTSLVVSNMDVRWMESATNNAGEVKGLALASYPLSTPGRYLRHCAISAVYAEAGTNEYRNLAVEWIDAGDTNVVLMRR